VLVISIFISVVQGNLQGNPCPKEKEALLQGCECLVGTKKIGKPWYVEEKVGKSAKVSKKQKMGTTY
jgi:hypothetical protein